MRFYYLLLIFLFISINLFAQPINDHCEDAISLDATNGGCYFNATLVLATQSLPASNCNSVLVQDIWFSFVADSTFHNISVNPSSGLDAVVEVRKGSACDGTFIACIDEGGGNGSIENLALNNLEKDSLYFIRIYDFTGVGNPPSSWTLDICVSGFSPLELPDIELVTPNGGVVYEAGEILTIQAEVEGVIAGKEIELSIDNGENWERIWNSSDPNPKFEFDWLVPSINAENCLIRASVFQSGQIISDQSDTTFIILTSDKPTFRLDQELSHLYWPFYNPAIFPDGNFHVPSEWQNQEEGVLITSNDVINTWFYGNDHYWSSGRWHHSGDNCFAQDWNFINGNNTDCQMYFFSPMDGKIIFMKNSCFNSNCASPTCTSGCGNYIVVQSTDDPTYVYRACHFSELNPDLKVGDEIKGGDWIARVGNEGSSTAAHVHFVLFKNMTVDDITTLSAGSPLSSNSDASIDPANLSDLCFDKAANFRLDVSLTNLATSIRPVRYEPQNEILLYPNPNNGQFQFSIDANAHHFMDIQIFDAIGKRIYQSKVNTYQSGELIKLDINNPTTGIHILQIRFDQEVLIRKFIVKDN